MAVITQTVATFAPYIYALCGLVALYQLYRLWQVRAERRQAVFTLEREKAISDLYSIFSVAMLLLLLMGATYFASSTLPRASVDGPESRPTLPPEFLLQIVPTSTPLPMTPSATPTATITPIPTIPALDPDSATATAAAARPAQETPAATPAAAPPALVVAAAACPDQRAVITSPGNGQTVSGVFSVLGTATHEQFNYYKVEFAPGADAAGGFTYLADGRGPVFNGALASVDTRGLSNGPWTFRLTVVDQTGNFPDPCQVTVIVQN